jgi:hypothetical protein
MVKLSDFGMYEYKGVLLLDFQNGRAMQVRLDGPGDVKTRQVQVDKINDVESDSPEWVSAPDYILANWIKDNSPVWQWLQENGANEVTVRMRMARLSYYSNASGEAAARGKSEMK